MLKRLTNKATWLGGIARGIFVQWSMVVGVSFLLGLTVFADSYTLSNTGMTSYQHVVQNGGGVTEISNTYTVDVPAGMAAKVTLVESGSGFVWQNCETSTFRQMVNGSYQTLQNRTTEFLSTATISLSMTCSPAVSWTETPIIGYLSNGMPRYGHYIYHYYTYYYAKMNYRIAVSYESLLPDLVVSSVSLSSTDAAVDETVTMTYTVRNAGRKNVTKETVVRIYDGDKQICGDQTVPALSCGATSTKTVTLPKLSAGKHMLKVVADALNAIEESYEGNNESTVSLRDYTRTPVVVTFDTNGGAEARTGTVIAGDKVGALSVPFRKGYDFAGWWTERAGGYQIDANEKVTVARTFYAHWTAKTSTITLNLQGGNGSSTVQATFDEILPMVPVPVREGHTFGGYWTGVNGTGTQYYSSDGRGFRKWDFEIPEAVLYAKWTGVAGAVQLDVQEGTGGSRSVSVTFECAMPDIVLPTRSGWAFQGYYSAPNGEGVQYYTASGVSARIWDQINESAVMLYAYWLPNKMTYSLALDRQNGDGGSASVTATYATDMPKIDVPTRAQYVFEGYFTEPNGGGTQYYTADGVSARKWDLTPDNGRLYANWSKAYRVKLEPNGASGSATCGYFTEQVWHLAANPYVRSGYVFAGWAFEPDGVPTLADGAKVSKSLLGYGDDPNAEPVTLYAIWGKPLETSIFPGIKFVTGGVGTDPYWFEEDGALRSAVSASNSWLCATFENRGELQQVFEDMLYRQEWYSHDVRRDGTFVWTTADSVHTNLCSGVRREGRYTGVSCMTNTIPSGRHLVSWSYRKIFALNDWKDMEPTDDPCAILELYRTKTNELEMATQNLCTEYGRYIQQYDSLTNLIRTAVGAAVLNGGYDYVLSHNNIVDSMIRRTNGDYYEFRKSDYYIRYFNNLINALLMIVDDVVNMERGLNGYGVLRKLNWVDLCLVGFVAKEHCQNERAVELINRQTEAETLLELAIVDVCAAVYDCVEYNYYYSHYLDSDVVFGIVRQWIEAYLSDMNNVARYGFSSDMYDSIVRAVYDRFTYEGSLYNQDTKKRIVKLLNDTIVAIGLDILSLEQQLQACGVLSWKTVVPGDVVGSLPEPDAKEGYEFSGWWTAADGGVRVTEKTTVDADTMVFAHWTKKSYTLSFVTGTSESLAQRTLGHDEPLGKLPTPMREGYTFGGWTYSEGGKTATMLDVLTADVTLQAQWTKNTDWQGADESEESGWKISLTFDANGGTSDITSCGRNTGDTVGTLPIPARTGYQFDGWFTAKAGGDRVSETTVVRADVTYYAHWTANAYTIRFVANGGSGTMADQTLIYDVAQMLSANRFKYEGMHFVGWATRERGAVVYKNRAEVKNLTAEQGGLVYLYAVWEDGAAGLYSNDPVGAIGSNESAPYASVATTYDGYLYGEDDIVVGSVQVKVAKGKMDKKTGKFSAKVTATVQLADGSKKISFKGGVADAAGMVTGLTAKGHSLEVALGVNGLGGMFDGKYQIDGVRNVFGAKDAEAKSVAAAVDSNWAGKVINIVGGGEVLTVAIAKKGKVKVSGTVNGVKVSATSQLLVGETCCCIPVVITKKANLAFTLWLESGGIDVVGLDDGAVADTARPLKADAKFHVDDDGAALLAALGGKGEPYGEYLPEGLSVAQSGKKWVVADGAKAGKVTVGKTGVIDESKLGANPSGLKLTYTEKSGSFKGSFKVYNLENGKVKSYTVNVTGVMIGDVGCGTATLKKPACSFPISIK